MAPIFAEKSNKKFPICGKLYATLANLHHINLGLDYPITSAYGPRVNLLQTQEKLSENEKNNLTQTRKGKNRYENVVSI